jgi:hypothetical protein
MENENQPPLAHLITAYILIAMIKIACIGALWNFFLRQVFSAVPITFSQTAAFLLVIDLLFNLKITVTLPRMK